MDESDAQKLGPSAPIVAIEVTKTSYTVLMHTAMVFRLSPLGQFFSVLDGPRSVSRVIDGIEKTRMATHFGLNLFSQSLDRERLALLRKIYR